MEFRLPELGEGITSATVVNVLVKPGDRVAKDQTLFEVETDKASVPVPAPSDATVAEVLVQKGQQVPVGTVLAVFSGDGNGAAKAGPQAASPPPAAATSPPAPTAAQAPATPAAAAHRFEFSVPNLGEGIEGGTIVGVNVKPGDAVSEGQEAFTIETDKASVPIPAPVAGTVDEVRVKQGQKASIGTVLAVISVKPSAGTPAPQPPSPKAPSAPTPAPAAAPTAAPAVHRAAAAAVSADNGSGASHLPVPAGPATRRFARELGVNLREVPGSARGGRVTVDDVKGYVRTQMSAPRDGGGTSIVAPPLPDFSRFGPVERKPASNLRKKIAENLTLAWHMAPMVTQYDLADITDLEAGRKRISEGRPKNSAKITMTVLAVKAVVATLKEFPQFNASYDPERGELILKQYFHVGIAVDTDRGLLVPVIRDADKKGIPELAAAVNELAEKARTGKLAPDDMQGGTFTITNLGGIGGTAFSPIVRYPELAILGMARSSLQPVVRDGGSIEPRLMLPLCLTYDHRIIDGADGARFTARLARFLSDPVLLLMGG